VLASTPKGRDWFFDMFARGLDPAEKEYASFTFPSSVSPFFPPEEWDEARRTLPEDVYGANRSRVLDKRARTRQDVTRCQPKADSERLVEGTRRLLMPCSWIV
jgi:hypothetical protein